MKQGIMYIYLYMIIYMPCIYGMEIESIHNKREASRHSTPIPIPNDRMPESTLSELIREYHALEGKIIEKPYCTKESLKKQIRCARHLVAWYSHMNSIQSLELWQKKLQECQACKFMQKYNELETKILDSTANEKQLLEKQITCARYLHEYYTTIKKSEKTAQFWDGRLKRCQYKLLFDK